MNKYKDIIEVQRKAAICYVFVVPISVIGCAFIGYLCCPIGAFIGGACGIIVAMVAVICILK
jgi:hypothetical protein